MKSITELNTPKLTRATLKPGTSLVCNFDALTPGELAHLMGACEDHGPADTDPDTTEVFWGAGENGWRVRVEGCPAGLFADELEP